MSGPNGSGGDDWEPDFRPDEEMEQRPRRSRQPVIAVLAILGIILLVLALAINGGI